MRRGSFVGLGVRAARLRRSLSAAARDLEPELTAEEVAEFLAADLEPCDARPEFRDKLRSELWAMMQKFSRPGGGSAKTKPSRSRDDRVAPPRAAKKRRARSVIPSTPPDQSVQ